MALDRQPQTTDPLLGDDPGRHISNLVLMIIVVVVVYPRTRTM
jgi:hypothetical protein